MSLLRDFVWMDLADDYQQQQQQDVLVTLSILTANPRRAVSSWLGDLPMFPSSTGLVVLQLARHSSVSLIA
jgi:hypothetical protein